MSQIDMFTKSPVDWSPAPKPVIKFRPFQEDAVGTVKRIFLSGKSNKQLIVVATGGGKTIIFSELARWMIQERQRKVLILAHRDELLEQAAEKLSWIIPPGSRIEFEQGERHASDQADVVVASVATLGRTSSNRITKFKPNHFGLLVTDEAHHATASTYKNVLDYFISSSEVLSLGVTATPVRGDDESLEGVYDTLAYKADMLDLMRLGYLCPVVSHRVGSQTDLSRVRTTAGDFNLKDLAAAVNNDERNTLIIDTYLKRFRDKQAIVFATDLDHVMRLTEEFNKVGVTTAAISGEMPKQERRLAIERFKKGEIEVVCNFGVLTEGFDYDRLGLIIDARPTQSGLLLTQIIGRGTRICEGKSHLDFVEIIDHHSEKTVTAAQIFGFEQNFDCEEHHFLECIQLAERLQKEKEFFNPYACQSYSDMLLRYENSTRYNPMGQPLAEGAGGGGDREFKSDLYSEFRLENSAFFDGRYRYYVGRAGRLRFTHKDQDVGYRYLVSVYESGLGGWTAKIMRKEIANPDFKAPGELVHEVNSPTKPNAVKQIEEFIMSEYPSWDNLLWIKAPWRKRAAESPCSDKQFSLIEKFNLCDLPKERISKMMAADMIGAYFNSR